ncbi:MAG: RhtB family transporter, partial [uncultured Thermomicrobiales bacterium]
ARGVDAGPVRHHRVRPAPGARAGDALHRRPGYRPGPTGRAGVGPRDPGWRRGAHRRGRRRSLGHPRLVVRRVLGRQVPRRRLPGLPRAPNAAHPAVPARFTRRTAAVTGAGLRPGGPRQHPQPQDGPLLLCLPAAVRLPQFVYPSRGSAAGQIV